MPGIVNFQLELNFLIEMLIEVSGIESEMKSNRSKHTAGSVWWKLDFVIPFRVSSRNTYVKQCHIMVH